MFRGGDSAIAAADFSASHVIEFVSDHLLADGGDAVGVNGAQEVVELMLDDTCEKTCELLLVFFEIFVKPVEADVFEAFYIFRHTREG